MSKIDVDIIDVGQMGTYHTQIYQKLPQVGLRTLCEFNDNHRKKLETGFPGATLYKNYKELLKDITIEALSAVLPNNLHQETMEPAVQTGKYILLGEPLAKELEDGRALYEIIKDYDKVFTVGFLLHSDPRFAMVKERPDSNELGSIIHCCMRRNSPIIGLRHYTGASDLSMRVMIYSIDYINWWMGCQPARTFAKNHNALLEENGMNDVIYAPVTCENGTAACIGACRTLPKNSPAIIDDKIEPTGTRGITYVDSCGHGVRFVIKKGIQYPDDRHWYYVNGGVCGDLAEKVMAFANNAAINTRSVIIPKQSYDALRVVDTIEHSIMEGKEVAP